MIEPLAGLRNNKKKEKGKDDFKMKKFSLNTKRASKVLALALVAALVVPSVPGQNSSAASDGQVKYAGGQTAATVPDPVGKVNFSSKKQYIMPEKTTGKALKFSNQTATETFVDASGATYKSVDKAPVMEDGKFVYEEFDTVPAVVSDSALRGNVLKLNASRELPQYPAQAKTTADVLAANGQIAKTYSSGVEVVNPFATEEQRKKLFNESNYTMDKVAETATKVEREKITATSDAFAVANSIRPVMSIEGLPSDYDSNKNVITISSFADLKSRYSAPEAKTGVTISFWAKTPVDEDDYAIPTNFFEFSNTETTIYSTDDMGKVYIAQQYDKLKSNPDALNAKSSPFCIGDVIEGTIVAANGDAQKDAATQLKKSSWSDVKVKEDKFTYLANFGMYMKWNPAAAESKAAIAKDAKGEYKVYGVSYYNPWGVAAKKEIVVATDKTDKLGNPLYAHLLWSDTVYGEGAEGSNYEKFRAQDGSPYGKETRIIDGATGYLNMGTEETNYTRDNNSILKTGVVNNAASTQNGKLMNGEANTVAGIINPEVKETASDGAWHYYTITLTDEWFQVYVDGAACDPAKTTTWFQNTFNMGSGLYRPDGVYVYKGTDKNNAKTDYEKIANDDWSGSLYGQLFGTSVMDYITDPNTKLYIGGKTRTTSEGTLLDSFAFYNVALDKDQVAEEYKARKDVADPEPEPDVTVTLGDVDDNGKINADDALTILKKLAKIDVPKYVEEAADVDGNGKVNADDALLILKVLAKIPGAEFKQK